MKLLFGVAALLCSTPVLAQQAPPGQESHIMGFLLVPWGASAGDVTAAYGQPLVERLTPDSSSVMIYKDAALGKPVLSLFYLDKSGGLVRGVSSIPYGPGPECETIIRKSKESLLRTYPSLKPAEERIRQDTTVAFCD